jgi:uncharacterized protein with HEPN domain/predicted nucleotidyltransferase
MTVQDAVKEHREEILRIAAQHGATNVRVFGSVARGTAGPDSDLDLLVDVTGPTSAWFPAGLMVDLEELLGCTVDIATPNTLHCRIRDRVLIEAQPIGEKVGPGSAALRDQGLYLETILEAIARIQRFTADGCDTFTEHRMTQDAVLHNLQVLSESCTRMSCEIRDRRTEIDWNRLAALRDLIVTYHLDIDLVMIWEIIQTDLPPLAVVIAEELARIDAEVQDRDREGTP